MQTQVYSYPDDFTAVWVMIGVTYRPLDTTTAASGAARHLDTSMGNVLGSVVDYEPPADRPGNVDVFGAAKLQ